MTVNTRNQRLSSNRALPKSILHLSYSFGISSGHKHEVFVVSFWRAPWGLPPIRTDKFAWYPHGHPYRGPTPFSDGSQTTSDSRSRPARLSVAGALLEDHDGSDTARSRGRWKSGPMLSLTDRMDHLSSPSQLAPLSRPANFLRTISWSICRTKNKLAPRCFSLVFSSRTC